jgi:hypothetical protein
VRRRRRRRTRRRRRRRRTRVTQLRKKNVICTAHESIPADKEAKGGHKPKGATVKRSSTGSAIDFSLVIRCSRFIPPRFKFLGAAGSRIHSGSGEMSSSTSEIAMTVLQHPKSSTVTGGPVGTRLG